MSIVLSGQSNLLISPIQERVFSTVLVLPCFLLSRPLVLLICRDGRARAIRAVEEGAPLLFPLRPVSSDITVLRFLTLFALIGLYIFSGHRDLISPLHLHFCCSASFRSTSFIAIPPLFSGRFTISFFLHFYRKSSPFILFVVFLAIQQQADRKSVV